MAMKVFTGGNKKKFQMTTNFFQTVMKSFFGCNQKFLVVKLMAKTEHHWSNNYFFFCDNRKKI